LTPELKKGIDMMHVGSGKRDEWEFEYTASTLAKGATDQRAFRLGRVEWWKEAKAKVMAEVRESGLEISESVAAQISNYATTAMNGPQISVRADLQKKLAECHGKIQSHQQAADEYDGWVQVLSANAEARLKLTQADWLYFFGKT
jgi:histidinol-phosphate/aromatic aminotransferase/cobyric acid decarboxylase-like protein